MSLITTFYDSVDPAGIPAHPGGVFAYGDGHFAWPGSAIARYRAAGVPVRIIDVNGSMPRIAHVLDVERFDATPAQAHQWITERHAAGKTAMIYANLATVPAVIEACHGKSYHIWLARWDGRGVIETLDHLPPGVIIAGHQYASHPSYDASIMATAWVAATARE